MPHQTIALGSICLVATQSYADMCAGGECVCVVTCILQAVQRAHEQDTLMHCMYREIRLTCPQRVDIAPAKPASTLLPTTLMRELPNAAAASSAGPKWPTRITLTKETSLFNKKPVDTGIDRRTMVYISPLLASQRLRKASMPSTACTLSDRKRQTPEVKLYWPITAASFAKVQRWGEHKYVDSTRPLSSRGDRTFFGQYCHGGLPHRIDSSLSNQARKRHRYACCCLFRNTQAQKARSQHARAL